MNAAVNLKSNLIAYILAAVSALAGLITIITYPVSVTGTGAYVALITVLTVLAIAMQVVSVFFDLKGFAPLISLLLYSLSMGVFIASRMEAFNLLNVGIGVFGNMPAYVSTIVFYGIAIVACLASAVMFGGKKKN